MTELGRTKQRVRGQEPQVGVSSREVSLGWGPGHKRSRRVWVREWTQSIASSVERLTRDAHLWVDQLAPGLPFHHEQP